MKTLYQLGTLRTHNFEDPDVGQRIAQLWQQALSTPIQHATYYGIYHQYASDFRGEYDLTIAADAAPPNNTTLFLLDDQAQYQRFEVNIDDPQQAHLAVFQTWQTIWQTPLQRRYTTDFEVYYPDGRIEIFIAIY